MNAQLSMNPDVARKLLQVGEAFRIPGPFFSYEEIKVGNVNHTYKVNYIRDDGTGMARIKSYLVQRVNTYAFQQSRAMAFMASIFLRISFASAIWQRVRTRLCSG